MFAVIVVGLALTLMFFTRFMVKEGILGYGDKFFQCFTATLAAAIFFILLSSLQVPLAFTADISPTTMLLGIFATLLFTLPILFIDTTPKQTTSLSELKAKAESLKDKLGILQAQIDNVKENIPVIVSAPEGKCLIIKDSLDEMLKKIVMRDLDQSDLDKKFAELSQLSMDKDAAEAELNKILSEYQIFANCEFSDWVGKLKVVGLTIKTTTSTNYENEMPLEQRIEAIKQVLESGRALVKEVVAVVEPIYGIIKPLYDPSLPEKSRAVEFANEKLLKKEAPWIAVEALYNSLNNWKRQYSSEIQASMRYLRNSINPIANLSFQSETLPSVFGENTDKVLNYAKKAESMKEVAEQRAEKEKVDILDLIALKEDVQVFISMSNDILSMLYNSLVNDEEAIDRLLPTKDYLWEKNSTLRDRLKTTTEILSSTSNYQINQIMENLPKYLSYVDEAVQTLAAYTERKEFLLNYPLAEAAIEDQLKVKEKLLPQDLPFHPRFAAEYLRLYYTQRFGDYAFDKDNLILTKRP
jgi:chromosome segregation ATPase